MPGSFRQKLASSWTSAAFCACCWCWSAARAVPPTGSPTYVPCHPPTVRPPPLKHAPGSTACTRVRCNFQHLQCCVRHMQFWGTARRPPLPPSSSMVHLPCEGPRPPPAPLWQYGNRSATSAAPTAAGDPFWWRPEEVALLRGTRLGRAVELHQAGLLTLQRHLQRLHQLYRCSTVPLPLRLHHLYKSSTVPLCSQTTRAQCTRHSPTRHSTRRSTRHSTRRSTRHSARLSSAKCLPRFASPCVPHRPL
jgi:hypothetical protein